MPILQTPSIPYGDSFPPVLARLYGLRSPMHVDLDLTLYPGNKVFAPGFFAGTHTGGKYRFLPRTKFVSNAGAVVTVTPFTAGIFAAGDVITVINLADGTAGAAVGTVATIQHAANTITLQAAPGTPPAAGTPIGVATSRPVKANGDKLGVLTPNTAVNLMTRPNTQFGCFSSATLYRARMPHLDSELERLYPELQYC